MRLHLIGIAFLAFAGPLFAHASPFISNTDHSVAGVLIEHSTLTSAGVGGNTTVNVTGAIHYVSVYMNYASPFGDTRKLQISFCAADALPGDPSFSGCTVPTCTTEFDDAGIMAAGSGEGWYTFNLADHTGGSNCDGYDAAGHKLSFGLWPLGVGYSGDGYLQWFGSASAPSSFDSNDGTGWGTTNTFGGVAIQLDGSYPSDLHVPTETAIVSVQPPGGTTIASSSAATIGAAGRVSQGGTALHISWVRNQDLQAAVASPSLLTKQVDFSFANPIEFSVSTTTAPLREGQYSMRTWITKPLFSLFGFSIGSQTIVSTSTTFYSGAPTPLDLIQADMASTTRAVMEGADLGNACNISGFDLLKCLTALVIPSAVLQDQLFQQFHDDVLAVVPLGYATRVFVIVSGNATTTATSTLPSLVISVPSGLPGAGVSFNLTPWGQILGPDSILGRATSSMAAVGGTASGKTLKEIVLVPWTLFIYAIFSIRFLLDILGMLPHRSGKVV